MLTRPVGVINFPLRGTSHHNFCTPPRQFYLPLVLAIGIVSADSATNVYSLNRRAVRLSKNLLYLLISMRLVVLQKAMYFVP